jgi:hypothetical protein
MRICVKIISPQILSRKKQAQHTLVPVCKRMLRLLINLTPEKKSKTWRGKADNKI